MKKSFIAVMALALLGLSSSAMAAVSFDSSVGLNMPSDSRISGTARHFGVNFDLADDASVGYYIENNDWTLKASQDSVAGSPEDTTELFGTINAIRVQKSINKMVGVGIDIGSIDISQGDVSGAAAATAALAQNVPLVGIFGKVTHSASASDSVSVDLSATLGYRFADVDDTTVTGFAATEKALKDVNGAILNLGVTFSF